MMAQLWWAFVRVGLFSFGGGYCMIPLIQREVVERYGWLALGEFVDVIAIAEMTPGPVAVNSATYVGYQVAGVWGAAVATAGVTLPPFAIVLFLAAAYLRWRDLPVVGAAVKGLRAAVVALIATAGFMVGQVAVQDWPSLAIGVMVLTGTLVTRVHPLLWLAGAAVAGVVMSLFLT